jgi:hypothetical protein
VLADVLGVDYVGPASSNPDYFQVTEPSLFGTVMQPASPTRCMMAQLRAFVSAKAQLFWPTPTRRTSTAPASTSLRTASPRPSKTKPTTRRHASADANAIYIYGPVFSAYQKYGNLAFRALVGGCLRRLLPDPLVQTDAPGHLRRCL